MRNCSTRHAAAVAPGAGVWNVTQSQRCSTAAITPVSAAVGSGGLAGPAHPHCHIDRTPIVGARRRLGSMTDAADKRRKLRIPKHDFRLFIFNIRRFLCALGAIVRSHRISVQYVTAALHRPAACRPLRVHATTIQLLRYKWLLDDFCICHLWTLSAVGYYEFSRLLTLLA